MRYLSVVVSAVGGMLALGACGLQPVTPSAAAPAPIPTTTATAISSPSAPSAAPNTPPETGNTRRTVTETRVIPFRTTKLNDPTLAQGTNKVRTQGRTGLKTLTYEVTFTDGVQIGKRLIRAVITRAPVTRVIAVGTRQNRHCDQNYSGACVPIAGDVDCAGGSGNGPAYVRGPVQVIGTDIYDLDRDGDGIACDD